MGFQRDGFLKSSTSARSNLIRCFRAEFKNLASQLSERFTQKFADLEREIDEGRSHRSDRSAKEERSYLVLSEGFKSLQRVGERLGTKADRLVDLLIPYLTRSGPLLPGVPVLEEPLTEEQWDEAAEALGGVPVAEQGENPGAPRRGRRFISEEGSG